MVDLRHFRSFVAVAEEGKISRAAERLFITQPALSRQIQQLEREVGEPLLVRGPHGVELTDAGHELFDKARVAIEAAEDALAVGQPIQPHGRLVVGLPVAGGRERWFGLTQAFVDRFPAVDVEMREAMSEQLQRQVLERELDGAIAFVPRRLDGLAYTRVLEEPLSVWLHCEHRLASRSEITLADLHGEEVTLLGGASGRESGYNAAIQGLFTGTGVEPRFDEAPQIYPPQAGLAPSHVSIMVEVPYPDVVVRLPLVPTRTLPFEFVQRAETDRSAVRAFARFAREYLSS